MSTRKYLSGYEKRNKKRKTEETNFLVIQVMLTRKYMRMFKMKKILMKRGRI